MNITRIFATLLAALCVGLVPSGAYADWSFIFAPSTPGKMTLIYDPVTGEMSIDTGGRRFTTLELVALNGKVFNVENAKAAGWTDSFPNIVTPAKLFTLDTAGMGNRSMGVQPGFGFCRELADNLAAIGSWKDAPREIDFVIYGCPEPSSMSLLAVGMAFLCGLRRISAGTR